MRPKLLKLGHKNFSEISDTKGGEPKFQIWGGEKKGVELKFFKNQRGEPDCPLLWLCTVASSLSEKVNVYDFDNLSSLY